MTGMNSPAPTDDVWVAATRRAVLERDIPDTRVASKRVSPFRRFLRRFLKQKTGMVAAVFLILVTLMAILTPLLLPIDPNVQNLRNILQWPGGEHLLGTDDLGRDVLARLMHGTRISLMAAVQATSIAVAIGLPLGLIAGYVGGAVDKTIMFVNDAIMAMPGLLLAIAIVGMLGPGLSNAMVAIGIVFAPQIIRIVRGSVLSVKEETYIEASRSIGTQSWSIVARHVLPNVRSPFIIAVSLMMGRAMLSEASLSFLGMGAQYPDASWGAMLGRAFTYVDRAPFLIVFPGIAIAVVVLAFNIVGDAMRDSLGREARG
ncbi:ABC transporter permease [Homoserinimonas sp. A520]